MFTIAFNKRKVVSCSKDPLLINKLYQHRSLAELLAESQKTGIPPLPTRKGVYTGESVISRDVFDRIDSRDNIMLSMEENEAKLAQIHSEIDRDKARSDYKKLREEIRLELSKEKSNE